MKLLKLLIGVNLILASFQLHHLRSLKFSGGMQWEDN